MSKPDATPLETICALVFAICVLAALVLLAT